MICSLGPRFSVLCPYQKESVSQRFFKKNVHGQFVGTKEAVRNREVSIWRRSTVQKRKIVESVFLGKCFFLLFHSLSNSFSFLLYISELLSLSFPSKLWNLSISKSDSQPRLFFSYQHSSSTHCMPMCMQFVCPGLFTWKLGLYFKRK